MPAPVQTDTSWQVQSVSAYPQGPGRYQLTNVGVVQTNWDTALALAQTLTGPVRILGLQSGNFVEVVDGAG